MTEDLPNSLLPKASKLLSRTNPGTYPSYFHNQISGTIFHRTGNIPGSGTYIGGTQESYNPGPRPSSPGSEAHAAPLSNILCVHSHLSKGVLTTCCKGCPERLKSELTMKGRQALFCCKCRAKGWAPNMGLTSPAGQKLPPSCCPSGLSAGSSVYGPQTSTYPQAYLFCCS